MNRGDVVVLRADKIYADYGKPITYYLVLEEHENDLITIHNPTTRDTIATFRRDLILVSKSVNEKNF